jgi:hypothetical protein
MDSFFRIAFVTGALSMAVTLVSGKSRHEIAPEETLHIRLYDRVQIPKETVQWAVVESSRMFRTAEIELEWERPSVESSEDSGLDMSSPAAPRTHPERQYFVIRILPTAPANIFPGALGFALPFAEVGAHVTIFYDRVAATALSWDVSPYVVLGCAMAHEIGHVLLRSSDHSSVGLMQAHWNRATWHLASEGLLAFLPEQKSRMRERVLRFSPR